MKRRKKQEPKKHKFFAQFEIPDDIIFDVPRVIVLDNSEIRIENYKNILEYEENKISIACKDKFINISGEKLAITLITDDEISVTGKISAIEYA